MFTFFLVRWYVEQSFARGCPGVSGHLLAKSGCLSTSEIMCLGVRIGCWVLDIQQQIAHWCFLHIYPRNLCYLQWTSYGTVMSRHIKNGYSSFFHMHFLTPSSLFVEHPLMLSVYWLQSENRLASDDICDMILPCTVGSPPIHPHTYR